MIDPISNQGTQLGTALHPPIISTPEAPIFQGPNPKSIGEIPPKIVNLYDYPNLIHLFTESGLVPRTRRKLELLSGKKARQVVLAENTVGSADPNGTIYLGVDFLELAQSNPALLAGVMAHEWGHLMSQLGQGNLEDLNWDQIFELRREEEASADAFAGRILPLMGYSVEPLVQFLMQGKDKHATHKYYRPEIRAAIIRRAAQTTRDRQKLARGLFSKGVYANPYTSTLLGV